MSPCWNCGYFLRACCVSCPRSESRREEPWAAYLCSLIMFMVSEGAAMSGDGCFGECGEQAQYSMAGDISAWLSLSCCALHFVSSAGQEWYDDVGQPPSQSAAQAATRG
jgi:hypothetical protein